MDDSTTRRRWVPLGLGALVVAGTLLGGGTAHAAPTYRAHVTCDIQPDHAGKTYRLSATAYGSSPRTASGKAQKNIADRAARAGDSVLGCRGTTSRV